MGDVGDYWNEHREYKRKQKDRQRPFNCRLESELRRIAHVEELSPDGPHLRINGVIDFWPSTRTTRVLPGTDPEAIAAAQRLIKCARKATFAAISRGRL